MLAAVLAVATLVLPGSAGETVGWVLAGAMVVLPLARVAFLATRWRQLADRRYAGVATLLLVEVAIAAGVALTV